MAEKEGLLVAMGTKKVQEAFVQSSHFPLFILVDVTELSRDRKGLAQLEVCLQHIARRVAKHRGCLMVCEDRAVLALDSWRGAIAAATYIVEPWVDEPNLPAILRYMGETSDLNGLDAALKRDDFLDIVRPFVRAEPRTLAAFIQRAEQAVLAEIDGRGDAAEAREAEDRRRRTLHSRLKGFLVQKNELALRELLRVVGERYVERRVAEPILLSQLYGATATLVQKVDARRAPPRRAEPAGLDRDLPGRDQFCWAVRLLARETALLQGNFVVAVATLCREFLRSSAADALVADVCDDVALLALQGPDKRGRLPAARAELRNALNEFLK
jgi:hypothetical protein